MSTTEIGVDLSRYKLGWSDEEDYVYKPKKGLNEEIILSMSSMKDEPDWKSAPPGAPGGLEENND